MRLEIWGASGSILILVSTPLSYNRGKMLLNPVSFTHLAWDNCKSNHIAGSAAQIPNLSMPISCL